MTRRSRSPPQENLAALAAGEALRDKHPLFGRLTETIRWSVETNYGHGGAAHLTTCRDGRPGGLVSLVALNPWRRLDPAQWAYVMAQAQLHHAFSHADPRKPDLARSVACALIAADFLKALGFGARPPEAALVEEEGLGADLERIEATLREQGELLERLAPLNLSGPAESSFSFEAGVIEIPEKLRQERQELFAQALRASVFAAIDQAAGQIRVAKANSLAGRARAWFVTHYPLLAALAASFEIVEDAPLCRSLGISLAAVESEASRIYVNPDVPWSFEGLKFVMAHEMLHVGLRHEARRQGRDPFLWNVACDYVINGWLISMGVGEIPDHGLLLDEELGLEKDSAEALYDRIAADLRLQRRLAKARTLSGTGKPDMIGRQTPGWWRGAGVDLDEFYRRALNEGLELHLAQGGRGLLPGELIEEIRALQHKPIPWDVKLAQWLDAFFPPLEAKRSFARASRRQASTPEIPRPVWIRPEERLKARVFGVVLDSSGSMSSRLLAHALGAIASYALSREVPVVRVVQCDAGVHDMGYVEPESLLGRVEIRGRGGTLLQPAIARLQSAPDFPASAPILIITDGLCDALSVAREHAWLMPEGARLPFSTSAPRFAFDRD